MGRVARSGDTDFTVERLVKRANGDLANGLGKLQNRTLALVHPSSQPPPGVTTIGQVPRATPNMSRTARRPTTAYTWRGPDKEGKAPAQRTEFEPPYGIEP